MKGIRRFAEGIKEGFLDFGMNITAIVNTFLLTAVYFAVIGPLSVFAKIAGKKFLENGKRAQSYWSDLKLDGNGIDRFYKQF